VNSDWLGYLIFAGVAAFVASKIHAGFKQGANPDAHKMHCTRCHTQAVPNDIEKGSFIVEVMLYLFFIVPGIVYTLWRRSLGRRACPACGCEQLIPVDSPAAQRAQ
jgi:hypothetical protein